MDQFTSIFARKDHALLLDCRARTVTQVPMTDPDVTVLILNTHVRHKLAESEYAHRRSECETAARLLQKPALRDVSLKELKAAAKRMDPVVFKRARHVITENQRTLLAAKAIHAGDWSAVGRLMYESHASLRDDFQVSSPELDAAVEIARGLGDKEGVIGCRMTGAGFGGCAVMLVQTGAVLSITRKLGDAYERKLNSQATIFSSRPADGARVLSSR
jgi:galactokinase